MTDFWKGKRVLVTGGAGFLGTHIVRTLHERGADFKVADVGEGDLRVYNECRDALHDFLPQIVFHLAAKVGGISQNISAPADFIYENILLGANIFHASAELGVGKLVVAGSACAYPERVVNPIDEDMLWLGHPEESNGPYGVAKRVLVTMAEAYRKQYGLNCNVIVPTNMYGPGDKSHHVIPDLIAKFDAAVEEGVQTVKCMGTGEAKRDFLYVTDAADAFIKSAEFYDGGLPMNIGSGSDISIAVLARKIANACGYQGEIIWDGEGPNGQANRLLRVTRAERLIGFKPKVSLDQGLELTIAAHRMSASPLL